MDDSEPLAQQNHTPEERLIYSAFILKQGHSFDTFDNPDAPRFVHRDCLLWPVSAIYKLWVLLSFELWVGLRALTQNLLKLSSKPLEGFLESFIRFRENLWHLSDDSTKVLREGNNVAFSPSVMIENDKARYGTINWLKILIFRKKSVIFD